MANVYEVYHYRYLDGVRVSSIVVTQRTEKEVENNFNGRMITIDKLGNDDGCFGEDEIRSKLNISDTLPFL